MALKPRTFRRVILIGSLVSVVLILAFGYFVVRPWQRQRTVDSMLVEGMAAAKEGDHVNATILIGRYISRTDDPAPEVLLAFSRSRVKYQASDFGHIRVAIRSYRSYLAQVPDDVEVAKELLPLFNTARMFLEAKELAQTLRTEHHDTSIEVIREELDALAGLDEDGPLVEELLTMSVEHPDAQFRDLFRYFGWLVNADRRDEAEAFVQARLASDPEGVDTRLVALWMRISGGDELNVELVDSYIRELCALLGLDLQTRQWAAEPVFLTPEMTIFVDKLFNSFRRPDLSLAVRLASARVIGDTDSMMWAARRLYWQGELEKLAQLETHNGSGDPVPDVLGYQVLGVRQMGDEASESALRSELDAIELDFRAQAWVELLEGLDLLEEDQTVPARAKVKKALGAYPVEPTFYLISGDIFARHGRLEQAKAQWVQAQAIVSELAGQIGWLDPSIRIINAFAQAGRLSEVLDEVNRLVEIAPENPVSTMIWLRSYASLARNNELDRAITQNILLRFEGVGSSLSAEQLAVISPQIATLYASIGQSEQARSVLTSAISASPGEQVLLDILEVDQRYELGIAQSAGIDAEALVLSSPGRALNHALTIFAQTQQIEDGMAIIEEGARLAGEEDAYPWDLARARYLDAVETPGAKDGQAAQAWMALRAAHPDDIDLLYQIVESNAIGRDLGLVNELIDEIVEKTSTAGQTLPSRLRLARASAIMSSNGDGQAPVRSMRDQALEIVRSVVASEPQNIKARNMLGRLLSMRPSPALSNPEDIFEPDIEGAIEQYVTISRQLRGRAAQQYLFEAIDLSFEHDDEDKARQYLIEFDSRFPNDFEVLPHVARRLENIGEFESAAEIYTRVYQNADTAQAKMDAGLALVNVYSAQDERRLVFALLEDLRSMSEIEPDQLVELASLHARNGYKPEGDLLAKSGEDYGLDPIESKMVYAKYAGSFISGEAFESALKEVVELDPTNEEAWTLLIQRFVREQRFDEAQEAVASAIAQMPESKGLRALSVLAQGELESASVLFETGAIEPNAFVREAVERVDEYMASKGQVTLDEQVAMLTSMLDRFVDFAPVQRFALSELNATGVNPALIAEHADRAARQMPADSLIMRIAGNAYLRASNPTEALRIARLWRANISGSPLEPDLLIAQAMLQMENYEEASKAAGPYVLGAIERPDERLNAAILHAYSHAQLMQGEEPQVTAGRLEPLLEGDHALVRQIWLSLAMGSVPTHQEAARWIEVFASHATPEDTLVMANTWLGVIERFDEPLPDYAQRGIDLLEPVVQAGAENPAYMGTLGRLYLELSKVTEDQARRKALLKQAAAMMAQADQVDPRNPVFLAQSALFETMAEDFAAAESKYRQLLARELSPGRFLATILNNLAMVIERQAADSARLDEAYALSVRATEMFENPSFWGTRGWIELALGKLDQAEASFEQVVARDAGNLEGWVGLAIVQHAIGPSRADDAADSFARVTELVESAAGPISEDLMDRLRDQGDERWTSVLTP